MPKHGNKNGCGRKLLRPHPYQVQWANLVQTSLQQLILQKAMASLSSPFRLLSAYLLHQDGQDAH